MKFILDTHLLLWWVDNSPSLSVATVELISQSENTIFVSAVSLWEIRLKESIGKLKVPRHFDLRLAEEGFENLPLTARQTNRIATLPWIHRDPFDRMLVAQAEAEKMVLLTADERLASYGASVRFSGR